MKTLTALAILVLASLSLAACGSSGGGSTETEGAESAPAAGGSGNGAEGASGEGGGGGSIVNIATPSGANLEFTTSQATAKAGQVSIEFENAEPLQHDVAIEDSSGKVLGKTALVAEGKATATVKLKPGTYTFFCTVPGHRQAGMEGTLTVK